MTQETFAEKFPELEGIHTMKCGGLEWKRTEDIEKHCLSKQKVREAIVKHYRCSGYDGECTKDPEIYGGCLGSILKELGLEGLEDE